MYTGISIKNLRCLSSIRFEKLSRINLITGQNNAGKTTILEGFFLSVGHHNATLPIRVNALRGVSSFPANPGDVWGWLFYNKHLKDRIIIEGTLEGNQHEHLSIGIANGQSSQAILPGTTCESLSGISSSEAGVVLELRYVSPIGEVSVATARIEADGRIIGDTEKVALQEKAIFVTSASQLASENANRYGLLEKHKREKGFLQYVQRIDPAIQRLSVISSAGVPTLHADVGLSELIPLQYLGGGTSRLITLLLAIYDTAKGVVLIDEIDNGIHHSHLSEMWRVIQEAAVDVDCQVVATTHSYDCISAAADVFESAPEDLFALHRVEPGETGHSVHTLHSSELAVAVQHYLEVR